jgi:hypothetical protein
MEKKIEPPYAALKAGERLTRDPEMGKGPRRGSDKITAEVGCFRLTVSAVKYM